jgi:zinc transporter, ZIP family
VSVALLAAIYVSNLPEGIGGATELKASGRDSRQVLRLWVAVAVACMLATPLGYALIDITSDDVQGGINGFAAGALIVMLVDSMIPDATEQAGRTTGLVTTLGFAVGAGLSFA